ncbi:MAG: ABC transporter permease [Lachnospiraceae bacterium]|jgi:spermidine/putrescine transport system permease protein|nr:ABC transporter permease [Lachnospiraceae bacterium]
MKNIIKKIYLILMLFYLYAPILVLIVLSFNEARSRVVWGGFSLKWYADLFRNQMVLDALKTTLVIAFSSALAATVLGTLACLGINRMRRFPRTVVMGINNIPMMNADIVTGIALMLCFMAFGVTLSLQTVLLAHITFNVPYVILSVMPKLKQLEGGAYEAALDLGASPVYAFFRVVMPDLMPGILSGFLMAFTMSLDDFVITHFTTGAGVNTLSTLIYSEVRRGIKPTLYALSALMFISVLVLLILINVRPQKKEMID